MKNSNFRNSFISTLTVTVVGVLLFGVNAVFSETPTVSPPGDGVGPTFTGVNIGTAWAKLQMVDVLDVKGKITNSIPFTAVTVNDAMEVVGTLIVSGEGATDVTFGTELTNGLGITGDTLLNGDVTISGNISKTGDEPVAIDDSLKVTGDWLITDGSTDIHGYILNTATEDAIGMTTMNADGTPLQIDLPVEIDDNVVVNKDLSIKGEITGDLSVTGKITADGGIGTFTRFMSDSDGNNSNGYTPYTVGAGIGTDKTLSCPAGSKVISCQVKPTEVTGYDIKNFSLSAYMDEALTYCKATVHNGSTTEKKFSIYQICFDSTQ